MPILCAACEDAQHQKDEAGFHIVTCVCGRQKYHTGGGCHGTRGETALKGNQRLCC
ncbi:hypothetical protein HMPREF0201_02841 [Cedecea davisae DSM 4568]|uniref:Uncharacterized protein n=1 Tax=Cedecea davisae DSM 4568 TaxID=566551 RepID=S3IRR5_9ENTR|nr:hypothetical protein HMPREF0201_02841 [Cedecea davisae DSM 4568]